MATAAKESSSIAASTTTTTSTTNSHPDTVVFGSLAFSIADEFSQSIDEALVDGVASLPGDDTSVLLQKLRRLYFRNVDVMESYLLRNIFTLDNTTRKHKIVQAYLSGGSLESLENDDTMLAKENSTAVNTTTSSVQVQDYQYPKASDIPSSQELETLQADVVEKRNQVRAARRRRNEILAKLKQLASAHDAVQGVSTSLEQHTNATSTTTQESIQQVVMGKDRLETLQTSASDLVQKLEQSKRDRTDDGDEEEEDDLGTKKTKLTLEQQYKEQRSVTKTTQGSLQQVTKLLQK